MPSLRSHTLTCPFCEKKIVYLYKLNEFSIYRCKGCGTISSDPKPSKEELRDYYQGFRFQGHLQNYQRIRTEATREWLRSFVTPGASMLDFGGGGGFYAKAFEDFGLGSSTYIDIDHDACSFAKNKLGLKEVINGSIDTLTTPFLAKFDIIICRHVIEHLIDPVGCLHKLIDLLKSNGTLFISCPNGISKEGLFYPAYWMKFVEPLAQSNGWSKSRALLNSVSRNFGWGMDPPRHLWAISPTGLREALDRRADIHYSVKSAQLSDPLYSPYFKSETRLGRCRDQLINMLIQRGFNGMHLVSEIRCIKKEDHT